MLSNGSQNYPSVPNEQKPPLFNLSSNLIILPPHRPISQSNSPMMIKYRDVVAIDIALLPNAMLSQWIIQDINKQIIKYGSFPFDASHFPHASLLHTIVPRDSIPQLCHDIQQICDHFNSCIQTWEQSVKTDSNPLYNSQTHQLQQLPHCYNTCHPQSSQSIDQISPNSALNSFLASCPSRAYPSLSPPQTESYTKSSYLSYSSLLAPSFLDPLHHKLVEPDVPDHFNWTVISPGPLWAEDTTLPYIGYPNPSIYSDSMQTNGLNIRLLHELITVLLHSHRISIFEAKPKHINDDSTSLPLLNPKLIDMKTVQTNGSDEELYDIAQTIYFTGDTLVPITTTSDNISTHDVNETQFGRLSVKEIPVYSFSNISANTPDSTISVAQYPHLSTFTDSSLPITTSTHFQYQFYTSPRPFDIEPADASTLKYTNAFDENYMGNKYNPHITIGSGEPSLVRKFIIEQVSLAKNVDMNAKALELAKPIPVNLNECVIGVFQLGLNGSCRFPIFKTKINTSNPPSK